MQHPIIARALGLRWWLAAAGLAAGAVAHVATRAAPPVRMAIRVDCGQDCARAEQLADDVWSEVRGPDTPLDIVIDRDRLPQLAHLRWQIIDPDIDATAAAERARLQAPTAQRPGDWFAEYHDLAGVTDRLRLLAASAPDRATLQPIGGSYEGRPIWGLQIGHGPTKMLINGTMHAREWISTMVATCVADRLIRDYDRDAAVRAFVDSTTLWVVPVINPDGYQYTWAGNRYWRKNRHAQGVDLNRNFAVGFGGRGSSGNKRSDTYRGEYAFSEPETAALRDLAKRERFDLHVDFHAYGQMLLYPWGYRDAPSDDDAKFAVTGAQMAAAMHAEHGVTYQPQTGVAFYPASGIMTDWMYGEIGALSYTIELRPTWPRGAGGFVLPPDQIVPTCDEGLAGVLALRAAK